MNRPTWHEYFLAQAIVAASRSEDPRTNHGAVLTNHQNKILSVGYNGLPSYFQDSSVLKYETKNNFCVHAEENCLLNCPTALARDTTIYITGKPCNHCKMLMWQGGVRRIFMLERSGWRHDEDELHKMVAKTLNDNLGFRIYIHPITEYLKPLVTNYLRFGGEKGK
jgi:dCMP deaminase